MGNGFTLYPTNKQQLKFVNKSGNNSTINKPKQPGVGEGISEEPPKSREIPNRQVDRNFVINLKSDCVDLFKDEK